jgi:hypothetical protein
LDERLARPHCTGELTGAGPHTGEAVGQRPQRRNLAARRARGLPTVGGGSVRRLYGHAGGTSQRARLNTRDASPLEVPPHEAQ